jgi:hypothetical protein
MHSRTVHPGVTIIVLALFIGLLLLATGHNGNGGSSGQTSACPACAPATGYSGGFHDDDGTGDDGGGSSDGDGGGGDAGGGDGGGDG